MKKIWPHLLYAGITVVVFWNCIFYGETFFPTDWYEATKPWEQKEGVIPRIYNFDAVECIYSLRWFCFNKHIKEREILHWNPYIFSGCPGLSEAEFKYCYPLKLLLNFLFDVFTAYFLFLLIHFFFSAVAMRWFLLELKLSNFASTIGGAMWMLCGQSIVWFKYTSGVVASVFFPLALLFILRARDKKHLKYFVISIIFLATGCFGTYPFKGFVIMIGFWLLICLFFLFQKQLKLSQIFIFFVLLLCLVSVQLLPFIIFVSQMMRFPIEVKGGFFSYLPVLLTLICPRIFGGPTDRIDLLYNWYGTQVMFEMQGYIGLLPLLFLPFAFRQKPSHFQKFLLAVAVIILPFVFLPHLYYIITKIIPVASTLLVGRFLYLYSFCMITLCAFGFNQLPEVWRKGGKLILIIALILILFLCFMFFLSKQQFDNPLLSNVARLGKWVNIGEPVFLVPAVSLLLFGASILMRKKIGDSVFAGCMLAIVILDLILFFKAYNPTYKPSIFKTTPPEIKFLKSDKDIFRVIQHNKLNYWHCTLTNSLAPYGLYNPEGLYMGVLKRYFDLIYKTSEEKEQRKKVYRHINLSIDKHRDLLNLLNVKYVMVDEPQEMPEGFEKVEIPGATAVVYKNNHYLPRAFLEPYIKNCCPVKIKKYRPNEVELEFYNCSKHDLLVLSDTYYPGWRAFIDGKETEILPYMGALRSVKITPGYHNVKFSFMTPLFIEGLIISCLSLFICLYLTTKSN